MTDMSASQEIATRIACAMISGNDPIRTASLDVVVDAAIRVADRIVRKTNENDCQRFAELRQKASQP